MESNGASSSAVKAWSVCSIRSARELLKEVAPVIALVWYTGSSQPVRLPRERRASQPDPKGTGRLIAPRLVKQVSNHIIPYKTWVCNGYLKISLTLARVCWLRDGFR
jgi:hypothetical protein